MWNSCSTSAYAQQGFGRPGPGSWQCHVQPGWFPLGEGWPWQCSLVQDRQSAKQDRLVHVSSSVHVFNPALDPLEQAGRAVMPHQDSCFHCSLPLRFQCQPWNLSQSSLSRCMSVVVLNTTPCMFASVVNGINKGLSSPYHIAHLLLQGQHWLRIPRDG